MENKLKSSHPASASTLMVQTKKNSCTWIGHPAADTDDHFAGQTFECPRTGTIDNIQIFLSQVQSPGKVLISLHAFNPLTHSWGPALTMGQEIVTPHQQNNWLRFALEPVVLQKGETYGFRLAAVDALVALAEAVEGHQHPFTFGQEWNAHSNNRDGNYYSYFSLAFRMEMRA